MAFYKLSMRLKQMKTEYHYTECGLDNIILCNREIVQDDHGEQVVLIPNINGLHEFIALSIIDSENRMSGKELRFLRTLMGLTQDELAQIVQRKRLTINRWESGKTRINGAVETLLRQLVAEHFEVKKSVRETSIKRREKTRTEPIRIDCSDPKHYRLVA
ncbi:MAG: helix-turn-helix domain-containing protein [Alphaproteobacteria bacterium]|nr:helix-turn-helix domain-containing protein [Alphaproteobacteria bacterium]